MKKVFVCLAKSAREGGICLAGKEIQENGMVGNWFRPVGQLREALPRDEFTANVSIGDIISCEVYERQADNIQPENHSLASNPTWRTFDRLPRKRIYLLEDNPRYLWGSDSYNSSFHGINDRIRADVISQVESSLYFIKLDRARLTKTDESFENQTKYRLRLEFLYIDTKYNFRVTDIELNNKYWDRLGIGESTDVGPGYFTISLSKPYIGYCYKLVVGHVAL